MRAQVAMCYGIQGEVNIKYVLLMLKSAGVANVLGISSVKNVSLTSYIPPTMVAIFFSCSF